MNTVRVAEQKRLLAYADESGIEASAEYCIMAGYIGTARQWRKFERSWRKLLRRYHLREFHAKEFFQPERRRNAEPYSAWTHEQASALLRGLLEAIDATNLLPTACALHVPSFNRLDHDQRRYLTGGLLATHAVATMDGVVSLNADFKTSGAPSRPYFGALQRFIGQALVRAQEGTVVDFTFDHQQALEPRGLETFAEQFKGGHLPMRLQEKVGSIRYADSLSEPGLQAADLSAYVWNRSLQGKMGGQLLQRAAHSFSINQNSISVIGPEHLQSMLDSTIDDTIASMRRAAAIVGIRL